ncbi:hypothetical protein MBLNU13_g06574t3 [Cladosporium sp. NU13]
MRKTLRDPQSWFKSSATQTFDFENSTPGCVAASAGGEKDLFFFPDIDHDPYCILDEEEMRDAIQHPYKQSAKEDLIRSISLFVAADSDHVRAVSLDQCDLSSQVAQTVTVRLEDP